jgi:hypothetical protein
MRSAHWGSSPFAVFSTQIRGSAWPVSRSA